MQPKYPIYIISKGRADSRLTSRSLEQMNVPYRIVIEESEYEDYAAVIDPKKILVLPKDFRENPKWAIPDEKGLIGGGIPARNWVWDHSVSEGHARHWILDDNIRQFYRLNRNSKNKVMNGVCFRSCEDFSDRYENVKMSGMNYMYFCPASMKRPPYYLNTRVYSCILLSNDIPHRWRGRYNEDTDLSIRILKDKYCTLLFNNFLCGKSATMTMKGGNTEAVYAREGKDDQGKGFDNRYQFAKSLYDQHPDCVEITQKWGRWHHHVDYSKFKLENKLIKKPGLNIEKGKINEYGLVLKTYPTNPDHESKFWNDIEGDDNGDE
jgi:hypothetical protein